MSITNLTSTSQLNGILSSSKDKLSVIDFHATWCGPCHAIAPTFEALAKQYKNVNFLKCDVDATPDVAAMYSVSAMPTFVFLKGNTKVDVVRGVNRSALEENVRKYSSGSPAGQTTGAFSGKGQTLGGTQPSPIAGAVDGVTNLNPQAKVLLAMVGAYALLWYFS
ncbi:thioredoxin-like protein [Rickenella mellea]|uniref:Thioredoxin-like protein n=1 Tax=Rickenella mellea TaxID=50990 RepID=A0A4Y7QLW3_9AGAM|nr:thioredoxin-like protein [Rickenella mellea]